MYDRYRYLAFNTAMREVDPNCITNFIKCSNGIDFDSKWSIHMCDDRGMGKVIDAIAEMPNRKAVIGFAVSSTKIIISTSYGDNTRDYSNDAFNLTMISPVIANGALKKLLKATSNEKFEKIRQEYKEYETEIENHNDSYPYYTTYTKNQLDIVSAMFPKYY